MKIRITGASKPSYWYADRIGEVFDAEADPYFNGKPYRVPDCNDGTEDAGYVDECDCVIVTEDSGPITVLPDESLGGIKREYREVKRKANVGERIKALRPSSFYAEGELGTAKRYDMCGDLWVYFPGQGGASWCVGKHSEGHYVVLEPTDVVYVDDSDGVSRKYRMVEREATVGERVIVVNIRYQHDKAETLAVGQIGVCTSSDEFSDGSIDTTLTHDRDGFLNADRVEYRVLEPVCAQTSPRPLSERSSAEQAAENIASLTAKVQTLESRLNTLYDWHKRAMVDLRVAREDIVLIDEGVSEDIKSLKSRVKALEVGEELLQELPQKVADGIAELFEGPAPRSPQQIRDEIVERAKADVKALLSRNYPAFEGFRPSVWFTDKGGVCITDKCEFIVNREKRTVVALIKLVDGSRVERKGVAKCALNDVFNVWIGKAIALRRALGLEVPAEYLSVPNPTEVRVGDVVTYPPVKGRTEYEVVSLFDAPGNLRITKSVRNPQLVGGGAYASDGVGHTAIILDDTREVEGPASAQKGAAA